MLLSSLEVLPAELELSHAQDNSVIQGLMQQTGRKAARLSEHLLCVAHGCSDYVVISLLTTLQP